jgi:hypothetical protein
MVVLVGGFGVCFCDTMTAKKRVIFGWDTVYINTKDEFLLINALRRSSFLWLNVTSGVPTAILSSTNVSYLNPLIDKSISREFKLEEGKRRSSTL